MLKRGIVKALIAIVAIFAIGIVTGVGVAHPKDGLSTAMGSAKSSLVIYKKTQEIAAGDRVISKVNGEISPIFAVVTSTSGDNVALQFDNGFVSTTRNDLMGKMIVVIPFIGTIFGAIGL